MKLPKKLFNGFSPYSDQTFCHIGWHDIEDGDWFYILNSPGGYGRAALFACEDCIVKPENGDLLERACEVNGLDYDLTRPVI